MRLKYTFYAIAAALLVMAAQAVLADNIEAVEVPCYAEVPEPTL